MNDLLDIEEYRKSQMKVGFAEAIEGKPMPDNASPAYRIGWHDGQLYVAVADGGLVNE